MPYQYQYWEFDFNGQRHHCLEMPHKSILGHLRLSLCRYAGCVDHKEIFCMVHQETINSKLTDEQVSDLKIAIKYAKEHNQI